MNERMPGLITNVDNHPKNPAHILAWKLRGLGFPISIDNDPLDADGNPIPEHEMLAIRTADEEARQAYKAVYFTPEIQALTSSFVLKSTPPKVDACEKWSDEMKKRVLLQYWETVSHSKRLEQMADGLENAVCLEEQGVEGVGFIEMLDIVELAIKTAGITEKQS